MSKTDFSTVIQSVSSDVKNRIMKDFDEDKYIDKFCSRCQFNQLQLENNN